MAGHHIKLIIAGSRSIIDYNLLLEAIELAKQHKVIDNLANYETIEIISGGARGVDTLACQFAQNNGYELTEMIPEWKKLGKGAGLIRNTEMAEYGDILIAIWDGKSTGTKHMWNTMAKLNKPVFIYQV